MTATMKRAPVLPKARVILTCLECGRLIRTFDLAEQELAGEMFRARKEHAKEKHGWEA